MNGRQKQFLEINGKTLLRQASETAEASNFYPIIIVLGANAAKAKSEIEDTTARIIINENWEKGLSSSIEIGVKTLVNENPAVSAVCILLCDQPLITTEILNELAKVYKKSNKKIVACKYEETIGVPAIFSRELFGKLCEIKGDKGARDIIENHSETVETIDVPEAALDIDTPEDFQKLLSIK